ncbi:MAG TPA: hypothetical protein VJQ83_00620, partial [Tepidiformaceae bacterium]|nr:hypothetical protein [Tepidiformaceae bacterium]
MAATTHRWGLIAAALVAVSALLGVHHAAAAGSPRNAAQAPQPPPGLEQLAAQYAPVLQLKQQSSACNSNGDPYNPEPVEIVLGNQAIELRHRTSTGDPVVTTAPTAEDLFGKDETYYLDYPGSPRSRGCNYEQDAARFSAGKPSVTYVHLATQVGHPGFALQYWFFYYFNEWNNRHEGDWEMVQIDFAQDTPEAALGHEPELLIYSQHSGGETAQWDSGKLSKEDGHPVVYVGSGSHSNYYTPNLYFGKGEHGTGFGCDDATGPHRVVSPQVRLIPASVTASDPYAWITYEGAWGQLAGGEDDGPNGPNTTTQWTQPFAWAANQRDSSVTVPGGALVGGNASTFFCKTVSFGARALGFALSWPVVTGGSASIILVTMLGLVVVGVRDARQTVLLRTPVPGFLRQRRRFGQVVRLAIHFYRRHAGAMLTLTAIYIPLGMLALAVQDPLNSIPPFSNIIGFFDARPAGAFLGLLYGSIESLAAVIFIVSAVTAGLADLDRGLDFSPRRALRELYRKLGTLTLARLRAVGIVALLGISIIGIPFAVRQTVRWYFIEQSIIFDNASRQDAPARSAAAVDHEWLRSFFITLA